MMWYLILLLWRINLSISLWIFCKLHIFLLWVLWNFFKDFTSECNSFSRSTFPEMSSHSSLIHTSNLILLSDMSWLAKLAIPSFESNPNTLLYCQIFINVSFIEMYALTGVYLPLHAVVGCNPPCSHKFCLLSIKNWLLLSILDFLRVNIHKGSSR